MRRLVGIVTLSAILSGCGYDGSVRYECQEFKNWKEARCQPPECEVIGVCSKDLVPESIYEPPN